MDRRRFARFARLSASAQTRSLDSISSHRESLALRGYQDGVEALAPRRFFFADLRLMCAMLHRLQSPKLSSDSRRKAIYPYYAGFSESFVDSLIDTMGISESDVIVDPWNGSGTTTTVCARRGIASVGIDVNPAMKHIAAARCAQHTDVESAAGAALQALRRAPADSTNCSPFEYCAELYTSLEPSLSEDARSLVKFGLMAACRRLARETRSKNPTWYSRNAIRDLSFSTAAVHSTIGETFSTLLDWTSLRSDVSFSRPTLITSPLLSAGVSAPITHVITSPPYLTRIDYVMKTLPELEFLSRIGEADISMLRNEMLGTVLTRKHIDGNITSLLARSALESIKEHDTKASSTYYYRFFLSYFIHLELSLRKICGFSNMIRSITIVSQGSYYKEIFVDLPHIVSEILGGAGFAPKLEFAFVGKHSMAMLNRRAKASRLGTPPEIAIQFERQTR